MIDLTILTPDKSIYEGKVTSVTVPGTNGSFQILKDHAPIISTLEDGPVTLKIKEQEEVFHIKGGVVEVSKNNVILLAEAVSE